MNIVYFTPYFFPHIGGTEKYVSDLANYFSCSGHKIVIVVADRKSKEIRAEIEINNVRIVSLPVYDLSGILIPRTISLYKEVDKLLANANIVHLNDCKFLLSYLAKKNKAKLYLSSHGFIFHTKKHLFLKYLFFKLYVAKYSSYYNRIICVSENDYKTAQKYNISNLSLVLPGVDLWKFKTHTKNVKYSENTFLYWGRISENKGIINLLRKLSQIDNFHLYLVGKCDDEKYLNQINDFINENKLRDHVEILGPKSDEEISSLIEVTEFLVFPSLFEGFGMTLTESLSLNKKIIANKIISYQSILHRCNSEHFIFDFNDPSTKIIDKIMQLRENDTYPTNLEQFSIQKMVDEIEKIYNVY